MRCTNSWHFWRSYLPWWICLQETWPLLFWGKWPAKSENIQQKVPSDKASCQKCLHQLGNWPNSPFVPVGRTINMSELDKDCEQGTSLWTYFENDEEMQYFEVGWGSLARRVSGRQLDSLRIPIPWLEAPSKTSAPQTRHSGDHNWRGGKKKYGIQ